MEEEFSIIGSFKGHNVYFDDWFYYYITANGDRIVLDENKVSVNQLGRRI